VNIDQGDGTYIIMAHLSSIFVTNESEVAAGQLVGFEGTTGNSTGDHLHIGRHSGDAAEDGIYGTSEEGLEFVAGDGTLGTSVESIPVTDLTCDLTSGHYYASALPVPLWHPEGTLIKTPSESTVYLLEEGEARPFITEGSFLSRNYDFADVVLMSDSELACVGEGIDISNEREYSAVYDDKDGTGVWLLEGDSAASDRFRQKVNALGWQGVLKSWGISASTYDDLPQESDLDVLSDYPVNTTSVIYRDGSLVSPSDASDVYVMSGGIAMPIETWDTYLLAGFGSRTVLEVDRSEFNSVVTVHDLTTCGGPAEESEGTFTAEGGSLEEEEDEEETTIPDETVIEDEEEEDDETSSGSQEETEEEEATAPVEDELSLTWTTPGSSTATRIALSGEYTPSGGSAQGWASGLAEVSSDESVTYTRSMNEGDSLRFSVEYVIGSSTSWSCLGPFPPGTVQGTSLATWNGKTQSVVAADDPTSDGCGLIVTIDN
jgi:murein DD-endopeptidase MepM/ murein hydrolase activator NlpD